MREVKARIHSLDGDWDTVAITSEEDVNHVVVLYKGHHCKAIYNVFVNCYYVDDIFGQID